MFEVGKKYKARSGLLYECLAVYGDCAWLKSPYNDCGTYTKYQFEQGMLTEYKEPIKVERWVNVYGSRSFKRTLGHPYETKEEAERNKGHMYIATVKVEWEE